MYSTVAWFNSMGTAAISRPITMTANPTWLILGILRLRPRPLITTKFVNPTMKNVVHTSALSTPCRVRPW